MSFREAMPPRTTHQGLCPWTPLGDFRSPDSLCPTSKSWLRHWCQARLVAIMLSWVAPDVFRSHCPSKTHCQLRRGDAAVLTKNLIPLTLQWKGYPWWQQPAPLTQNILHRIRQVAPRCTLSLRSRESVPSQRAFRSVPSVFARLTAVTVYICRSAACRPASFDECKYDDVLVYVAGVSGRVAMQWRRCESEGWPTESTNSLAKLYS